jgi:3-oxoacyl-[acyl-carrier-protein] synthase II
VTARRAVVTGMGVVTSLGHDVETLWANVVAGRSGVSAIERFDPRLLPVRIGAEVKDLGPEPALDAADREAMDLVTQFAVVAAARALRDSGLEVGRDVDAERAAVVMASGAGAQTTIEDATVLLHHGGAGAIGASLVSRMLLNMVAAQVAIRAGIRGQAAVLATACSSGANAIGDALRLVQEGDADAVVCGGSEVAMHPLGVAGFCAARALSTRNEEPARASRPFDRDRGGFVLGEGAGALVIEELEHATSRAARIHAELIGYGSSCDAHHLTMPRADGSGAAACMRRALEDAGLGPEDVGYVNAHGTATRLGDISETCALRTTFGEHADALPCSSTKSMTGHLLGAAGAVEAILTVMALRSGILPPTINLDNPDPRCDLDHVANAARVRQAQVAITNSFAFGGHNVTLVFARS